MVVEYGKGIVETVDGFLDRALERVSSVKGSVIESRKNVSGYMSQLVVKYNQEKADVILKAKEYKSSLSGQVSETVKQAPEVVKHLSSKAASLTKQGLEISIGQEKAESVMNTVKTHTPRFVASFLSAGAPTETANSAAAVPTAPAESVTPPEAVAAH